MTGDGGRARGAAPAARFAGRRAELREISARAAAAAAGRPQIVVVEGRGGIGKTALVRQALAGLDGFRRLYVGCAGAEAHGLPTGSEPDAAQPAAASSDEAAFPRRPHLVPGPARGLRVVPPPGAGSAAAAGHQNARPGPGASPQARGHGVAARLINGLSSGAGTDAAGAAALPAARAPGPDRPAPSLLAVLEDLLGRGERIVIALDDVPRIDAASAAELTAALHGLRSGALLALVTARSPWRREPGTAPQVERLRHLLLAESGPSRIQLSELSAHETARLRDRSGRPLSEAAARRLHEYTGGHPALLSVLLDQEPAESTDSPGDLLGLSDPLVTGILRTVAALPGPSRDLLGAMAVFNAPGPLPVLATVAAVHDAADALEPLLESGLAEWDAVEAISPVRIRYPLYRDVVYRSLPAAKRAALHNRAASHALGADAWEHRAAASPGADPALAGALEREAERYYAAGEHERAAKLLMWSGDVFADQSEGERHLKRAAQWAPSLRTIDWGPGLRARLARCPPSAARELILGVLADNAGQYAQARALLAQARVRAEADPESRFLQPHADLALALALVNADPAEAPTQYRLAAAVLDRADVHAEQRAWAAACAAQAWGRMHGGPAAALAKLAELAPDAQVDGFAALPGAWSGGEQADAAARANAAADPDLAQALRVARDFAARHARDAGVAALFGPDPAQGADSALAQGERDSPDDHLASPDHSGLLTDPVSSSAHLRDSAPRFAPASASASRPGLTADSDSDSDSDSGRDAASAFGAVGSAASASASAIDFAPVSAPAYDSDSAAGAPSARPAAHASPDRDGADHGVAAEPPSSAARDVLLWARGEARLLSGRTRDGADDLARLLRHAEPGALDLVAPLARAYLGYAHFLLGDWRAAQQAAERALAATRGNAVLRLRIPAHAIAACVAAASGNTELAARHAQAAQRWQADCGPAGYSVFPALAVATAAQARADYERMLAALRPLAAVPGRGAQHQLWWRPLLVEALIGTGQVAAAHQELARLREISAAAAAEADAVVAPVAVAPANPVNPPNGHRAANGSAAAARNEVGVRGPVTALQGTNGGKHASAASHTAYLATTSGATPPSDPAARKSALSASEPKNTSPGSAPTVTVAWLEAWLATAGRDATAARARFEQAAARPPAPDDPPLHRARLEHEYGRLLMSLRQRKAAIGRLRRAHELYTALGARPFAERCARDLEEAGALVPAPGADAAETPAARALALLSPQERRIAALAAEGRTNQEVANEVFVSTKTVEYHLGNVFAKLGISSRRQLAARLAPPRDASGGAG